MTVTVNPEALRPLVDRCQALTAVAAQLAEAAEGYCRFQERLTALCARQLVPIPTRRTP